MHGYSSFKSFKKLIANDDFPAPVSAANATVSCSFIFAILLNSGNDFKFNILSSAVSNMFTASS